MKERFEYIDSIKGFAIFLMVMGHVIAWNYTDYKTVCIYDFKQLPNIKLGGLVWQIIYSFHMPLFFMVSGFLSYKIYDWQNFFPFLKKKISRLFIPWLCTIWIVYVLRGAIGYWFLLCLFELSILGFLMMVVMERINRKRRLLFDIVFILMIYAIFRFSCVTTWKILGIDLGRFVGALIPFGMGVLLRKYKSLFHVFIEQSWFYTIAILSFFILFISRYFEDLGIIPLYCVKLGGYLLPLLGSLIVFYTFSHGIYMRMRSVLSYLGRHSLPIYILHIAFVIQLPQVGSFILQQNAITSVTIQILYATVLTIFSISLSLVVYKIIVMSS